MSTTILSDAWDNFFHARVGEDGCKLGGCMRISFAILFLYDRLIFGLDLDQYFSPSHGILPLAFGRDHRGFTPYNWTLFEIFPESDLFLWIIYYIGFLQGLLLVTGIAPRLQLIGIMINLISFHNHNDLFWDGQDNMLRVWCFLLLFMPLHHVTIYEMWQTRHQMSRNGQQKATTPRDATESSWPMWPFRLWQIEMVLIYLGSSLGKLNGPLWIEGLAMYCISHTNDFYPGIFNPDILFNRVLPSKIITWSSLFVELTCFVSVWIPSLRLPTLVTMFVFHIGIDLAMNMHTFEYLTLTGWASFLAQPDARHEKPALLRKLVGNILIVGIIVLFAIDSFPSRVMYDLVVAVESPDSHVTSKLEGLLWHFRNSQENLHNQIYPIFAAAGIEQGVWDLFSGWPDDSNTVLIASIQFRNGTKQTWSSPDWSNMTWWERKRYARVMDYYENIEYESSKSAWRALCLYLAREFGDDVIIVDLGKYTESSLYPLPEGYKNGWLDVSRQFPMTCSKRKKMLTLQVK